MFRCVALAACFGLLAAVASRPAQATRDLVPVARIGPWPGMLNGPAVDPSANSSTAEVQPHEV